MATSPIPIIDIFAGPGGLGEGFSRVAAKDGAQAFRTALSIEKEPVARETLKLRAFLRAAKKSDLRAERRYHAEIGGSLTPAALYAEFPDLAEAAEREAWCMTLGPTAVGEVRRRIVASLPKGGTDWVLIGGPPCQAYSLAGRSRNRGTAGYVFEKDHRAQLYLEYLQILADHRPAVFVMENVKGLLSAQYHSDPMFDLIHHDLQAPSVALEGAGRAVQFKPKYDLYALTSETGPSTLFGLEPAPASFLIKAERFGVPQARHRVIIVGIRRDLDAGPPEPLDPTAPPSVLDVLSDLPRLRSGLSSQDDAKAWKDTVKAIDGASWLLKVPEDVQSVIRYAVSRLAIPNAGRGAERLPRDRSPAVMSGWFGKSAPKWTWNHSTRGHIPEDLARYLFVASWAKARGVSPDLGDFPRALLPDHRNAREAASGGPFGDRFRVQVGDRPSTTITSHISKDGHYYVHPDPTQCRSLTVREAARLQTFPDDYFFCGHRTSQYVQVGNAVPPYLAWQIGQRIAGVLGITSGGYPLP